jgi:hypothetical protein
MAAPVQLSVVITTNSGGTFTTQTVVVPIPSALRSLDSPQDASGQTGFSAVDQLVRAIFKANVFTDNKGNWWPSSVIQSITSQ